jgi:CBS domain-containing protein
MNGVDNYLRLGYIGTAPEREYGSRTGGKIMINVKEILDQKGHTAWTISPEAKVFEALELMSKKGLGALVVMEKDDVVGIISERDYARKIILMAAIPRTRRSGTS